MIIITWEGNIHKLHARWPPGPSFTASRKKKNKKKKIVNIFFYFPVAKFKGRQVMKIVHLHTHPPPPQLNEYQFFFLIFRGLSFGWLIVRNFWKLGHLHIRLIGIETSVGVCGPFTWHWHLSGEMWSSTWNAHARRRVRWSGNNRTKQQTFEKHFNFNEFWE